MLLQLRRLLSQPPSPASDDSIVIMPAVMVPVPIAVVIPMMIPVVVCVLHTDDVGSAAAVLKLM